MLPQAAKNGLGFRVHVNGDDTDDDKRFRDALDPKPSPKVLQTRHPPKPKPNIGALTNK